MAYRTIYSKPTANKLPGSDTNYHFRTVTRYEVDSSGKATGKSTTQLYYAPGPGGRTSSGQVWSPGNADGENFQPAGYALAAESTDGGASWTPKQYTQADADAISAIGNDRVGKDVLGATALQSLQTPGGRFYDTAQNSIINTAANDAPGNAPKLAAKLKNAAAVDPEANTDDKTGGGGSEDDTGDDENTVDVQDIQQLETEQLNADLKSKGRNRFTNVVYPLDLATTNQDVIRITMLEYVPKDFSIETFGFSDRTSARKRAGNAIGTVTLPIPGGISDNLSVQWSGQNMNALEAAAANVALTTIGEGFDAGAQSAIDIVNTVSGNAGEVRTALANAFAGAASGTGGQLLTRTTGAVINPNLELLFGGPSLRTFSFKFKMNAREAAESKAILKIIRFFKQGGAPQKSPSHLFLKSPHTFLIQYLHRGEGENPFMGRVKECALQSISVNYTPEGNYATFPDGAMTSYELTLGFGELEPIFNSDYSELDGDQDTMIGF